MPFDSLTGPDLTTRLTWLWNNRAVLNELQWQEFYVRVVHDIFAHYRYGELAGLLDHFDHDELCHECFQEKIYYADFNDRRDPTYRAFYRTMFHHFLVDTYRHHREEINLTDSFDVGQPLEDKGESEAIDAPATEAVAQVGAPDIEPLLNADFSRFLLGHVRAFIGTLDWVDRMLLKCWFSADGAIPLVRFQPVVGSRYNSRAVRLGIKVQAADEAYADYGSTRLGALWAEICAAWHEKHPGRFVPEYGIAELVSTAKVEALRLTEPDCRAALLQTGAIGRSEQTS